MKGKSVKNSLMIICLALVIVAGGVIGIISIHNIKIMTALANSNYEGDA